MQCTVTSENLSSLAINVRNRQMRVVVSTQTEVPNLDVLETKMDALRGPNLPRPGAIIAPRASVQGAIVPEDLNRRRAFLSKQNRRAIRFAKFYKVAVVVIVVVVVVVAVEVVVATSVRESC